MRLGQTRHRRAAPVPRSPVPPDIARPTSSLAGVLRPGRSGRYFTLTRPPCDPRLGPWVERYWCVRWSLPPGTHHESQVLTHPSVHLAVESGARPEDGLGSPAALVHGVVTRTFTAVLSGTGRVFGVKFRPGGFTALTGVGAGDLTDRVRTWSEVFGRGFADLAGFVDEDEDTARVRMDDHLLGVAPADVDPVYRRLLDVITTMLTDRALISVDQVCEVCDIRQRNLQRVFRRFVGVGPKWVLRRFRLHDAVTVLDNDPAVDLSTLATDLGWFDQAHFTRDFTDTIGVPPTVYLAGGAD